MTRVKAQRIILMGRLFGARGAVGKAVGSALTISLKFAAACLVQIAINQKMEIEQMTRMIVQVWLDNEAEAVDRPGRWELVEVEFKDFAAFCSAVDADNLIKGSKLWAYASDSVEHGKVISYRQPMAFRGDAVRRCEQPRWTFVEAQAGAA